VKLNIRYKREVYSDIGTVMVSMVKFGICMQPGVQPFDDFCLS